MEVLNNLCPFGKIDGLGEFSQFSMKYDTNAEMDGRGGITLKIYYLFNVTTK